MKYHSLQDTTYIIGLIAVSLCATILFGTILSGLENYKETGFMIIHIITLLYWIPLLFRFVFSRKSFNSDIIYPAAILSFIGCFSLNEIFPIFEKSPDWYYITVILLSITFIVIPLFNDLPGKIQYIFSFILGVGAIILLYLSIYLCPLYIFGIFGFLVLGIPTLSLTPLLMLIILLYWKYKSANAKNIRLKRGFLTGAGLAISLLVVFVALWSYEVRKINQNISAQASQEYTDTFPDWINIAQHITINPVTDKILKTDLVYVVIDEKLNNLFNRATQRFFEEKIHDPFVVVASLIGGKTNLTNKEKINILETVYNNRHQTVERLWSDEGIKTTHLETSVEIWPQYRIAYTEQVIKLRNDRTDSWSRGEAVYTFHLPEGSTVSSLSLWINGEERKGMLTTKEKADDAYQTIVGVEARDPSLVHWQEGSTVIVRVFPVSPKEERQFKIGVTTPLQISEKQLRYEPVYFEGTDFSKASEHLNISFMQEPENIDYPGFLKKEKTGKYEYKGNYRNNWQITMSQVPVSEEYFHFDGNKYFIKNPGSYANPVNIQNIYLDINRSWTEDDFNAVYKASAGKQVWVSDQEKMVLLTDKNKKEIFRKLQELQFSLFPVHEIENRKECMIISKSTLNSPNMKELENTSFLKILKSQLNPSEKILFYNLGNNLSPFLQTLLEYRILEYQQGDITSLREILQTNKFPVFMPENDNSIMIYQSGININKETCVEQQKGGKAPDHLMRLFIYNHILQQYTKSWEGDALISDQLIREAKEANIISPVSSLVVLETQADYDRFDIREAEKSIGNASTTTEHTPAGDLDIWILLILLIIGIKMKHRSQTDKERYS